MNPNLKWENYFLKHGEACLHFWEAFLRERRRNILYILAVGFDPRTYNGLKTLYSYSANGGARDVTAIRYFSTERMDDPIDTTVAGHIEEIEGFLRNKGYPLPTYKNLILRSDSDTTSASANAAKDIIESLSDVQSYSDVVLDISAMPRSIFISLANKLLTLIEHHNSGGLPKINLHLITTENSYLDSKIVERGIEDNPTFVQGYTIIEKARTSDYKKVWIPILGENQRDQFVKIRNLIQPDEICPILPFPSMNLRRGDELIDYYQDALIGDPAFNLANIIYADESNPFQTYRLLIEAIWRYKTSFDLLSGCKIYLSTLSSKLLSIGTFLAAYETKQAHLEVGILHVESRGHRIKEGVSEEEIKNIIRHNNLFEIWLTGEAYQ